jgi:HK97 family phage major capsid protein
MAKSISDQLMERRATLITQAQETAQRGVTEGRDLTVEEQTSFDQMIAEAGKLHERAKAIHEGEERARDLETSFRKVTGHEPVERGGQQGDGAFGKWAREARVGDGYDVGRSFRAEQRAIERYHGGAETRAMSASGGIGADSVYDQLWEYAVAMSQILQAGVDVINTSDGNTLPFPVATAHASTGNTPVAASGALTASDATVTTVNSTVAKYAYITLVPSELIQDVTFDLEGYIARAAARDLARQVGKVANTAYIAGFTTAGSTGPVGTTVSLGTQSTAGMGSDLLVDTFHSVLPEYRANSAWVMADPTAAVVRKLKASTGDPVWQPSLTAGDPDLILGKPVYIDPNLPSPGVSAKTIYFGEWSALKVRIAGGIRFERSNEYAFGNDQAAFRAIIRVGAVALDPNAVKFFVHSAT